MKFALSLIAGLAFATAAAAAPVQVPNLGIATFEDFEAVETGAKASPFAFSGGRYTSPSPVVTGDSFFCATGNCLTDGGVEGIRTLSGFPADTTQVGFNLNAIGGTDRFEIWTIGSAGSAVFTQTGGGPLAFEDPEGLVGLGIINLGSPSGGQGNYSFDNIYTSAFAFPSANPPVFEQAATLSEAASLVTTPLPGAAGMLAVGVGALVGAGARRRRAASKA